MIIPAMCFRFVPDYMMRSYKKEACWRFSEEMKVWRGCDGVTVELMMTGETNYYRGHCTVIHTELIGLPPGHSEEW